MLFGLALGPVLPVQARGAGIDDGNEIGHYLRAPVVGQVDDLDAPPLLPERCHNRAKANASRWIAVLDLTEPDGWIGEHLQERGAALIDASAELVHHLVYLIALGGARAHQSFRPGSPGLGACPPLRLVHTSPLPAERPKYLVRVLPPSRFRWQLDRQRAILLATSAMRLCSAL
jgi:hypothetical protein